MAVWHKEVWNSIDTSVDNADIVALYRRWLAERGQSGGLPDAQSFGVQGALAAWAPRLAVLDPVDGDFTYRHFGSELRDYTRADMTGRRLSEGDDYYGSEFAAFCRDSYRRVLERGQPLYTVHFSCRADWVFTWERLAIPLREPGGAASLVVYNQPSERRERMLQEVLNTASDAILALQPLRLSDTGTQDWMVTVVNAQFARLGGATGDHLAGLSVREALPRWDAMGFEGFCNAALQRENGQQRDIELQVDDGPPRWFSAYFGRLQDGCVIRLSDITAVKQNEQTLRESTLRLQSDNAQLRQLAWMDGLTGLSNRRALDVILEREVARARRKKEPLTLVMCDIDHFKAFNDFYGHLIGDDCIREVAHVLAETTVRSSDLVARYGGEEFVLVLPSTSIRGGLEVVQRTQAALHARALPDATSPGEKLLTLSFGVAEFDAEVDDSATALLERADAALYSAKHLGRNRVATYAEGMTGRARR
ncbi:diguanylate cyclase [Ramlibacter sp. H39-3-26]|uniref:GGDEF domain-containing protein n=1 Tax=Curvibacter soli TaxID=3031331 RepID=UPI0023DA72D3|nr:diguanylate cyclase [Ramlibacter sp. H39-3-26]MDF1483917.1 diguanylate cyclase [Ramlibacter sp. H39-3-26]